MRTRLPQPCRAPRAPRAPLALALALAFASLPLLAPPARAVWSTDPTVNTKVPFGFPGERHSTHSALPDSGGGMLLFGNSSASYGSGFVQRVDALGQPRFLSAFYSGLPLCAVELTSRPASDGNGGAYFAIDNRTSEIAVGYVRADGTGWPTTGTYGGVRVTSGSSYPFHWTRVVADGAGGAIAVWADTRTPNGLWAQRVNSAGTPVWTTGGVALQSTSLSALADWLQAVPDGAGGVVAVSASPLRSYSLRADGTRRTPAQGRLLCTTSGTQGRPDGYPPLMDSSIPDGHGGMIVVWMDTRSDANADLYAQRIDSLGYALWTANGVPVCTVAGAQSQVVVTPDGAGGAIVVWTDQRAGSAGADLYAQRLSPDGTPQWATDGVPVCGAAGDQSWPTVDTRTSGGAMVAWTDKRADSHGDIFAQSLDPDGNALWPLDGTAVCVANDDPLTYVSEQSGAVLVSNGHDGALVAWNDMRDIPGSIGSEPYAQYVPLEEGALLGIEPPPSLVPLARLCVAPNPAFASARVALVRDGSPRASLELLDVAGRVVRARDVSALAPGAREVTLDDLGALPAGVYVVRMRQGGSTATTRLMLMH